MHRAYICEVQKQLILDQAETEIISHNKKDVCTGMSN